MSEVKVSRLAAVAARMFSNGYLLWLSIVIIAMAGYSSLVNLPRIEDPRITNRYPNVITRLPGASAERIEALVTDPLEEALEELSEIKKIESTSRSGISVLAIELQDDVGPGENEQVFSMIRDRISDVAPMLPPGTFEPVFDDKIEAVAFSLVIAIRWTEPGDKPLGLMYRLAEQLADELRHLPGTDIVRYYGEPGEQITVDVDPAVLAEMGLSAADVANLIAAGDPKLPAGALRNESRSLAVEVDGELDSAAAVAATPLIQNAAGGVVRLGDVADVARGWQTPPAEIGYTNGVRSIMLGVRTEADIRLDRWSVRAREIVARYDERLGRGVEASVVFDQSLYTEARLASLGGNLLAGALVVMAVVFVGMGWRAAMIVGCALPLSASIAIFGLGPAGQQIHQMSIFGMIVAIGLLIDAAIVMTDEVKKHLDQGEERLRALSDSIGHLFVPLLASTLTTILGFMPVFLLPGAMGDFVGPVATSVVLALAASFFLAVTIIPVLAATFLPRRDRDVARQWWVEGVKSRALTARYRALLTAAMERPLLTVVAGLVLPLAGFGLASTLGQEFFPAADRDQFEIQVWMPRGTAISATEQVVQRIDAKLTDEAGITDIHWLIGHSFPTVYYNRIMRVRGDDSYAQAVVFTDTVQRATLLTKVLGSELSDAFPEARIVVAPYSQGPPLEAPVGFRIEGPDTAELVRLGAQLRATMHEVPEILQTRSSIEIGQPKLSFVADEVAVRQAGLTMTDLARQMQASLEGQVGGSVREDRESLPVRIRYPRSARDELSQVAAVQLVADGRATSALNLGRMNLIPESSQITRFNSTRANKVFAYLAPGALAVDVSRAVLARLDAQDFELPPGYSLNAEGDSDAQADAIGNLVTYLPVLLMLMLATIILSFRSLRLASVIGVVAVLSVGLGMLSLWLGGYPRGFNAIIGVAGLIGVAINGTIVVIAAIRSHPAASRGDADGIVEQTLGATRHIISTVFTTIGGFVPLVVFSGGDFWPPLAVVIAGGVGFSITLSLFFTPAMYCLLSRLGERTGYPLAKPDAPV